LFGTGSFLYGRTAQGIAWTVVLVASTVGLLKLIPGMWRSSED
jgi:hypothetical protein